MKSISTAILLSLIVIVTSPSTVLSEELTPGKEKAILKLLEVTQSKNIGLQMGNAINQSLANSLKTSNPEIPNRAFEILAEETNNLMVKGIDDLINSIIPLYHKYFTKAEIEELLAFYETPIGRKSITIMPQLMGESMALGQKWGENIVPELVANLQSRFKEAGIEIEN
jgi:hypothetical protein